MNVIQIPFEHKMFSTEIEGELSNFIYDEFSLLYTLKDKMVLGVTVFFVSDKGDISGTEIYLVRHNDEWLNDIAYKVVLNEKSKNGFDVYCNSLDKKYTEIGVEIAEIVFRTMLYIMNTPRDKVVKLKIPKEQREEKLKGISDNNGNKIYLLDEIIEYVNENRLRITSSGTHTINCPCWIVRGHYRHYKSGKIVFIKSYEKGKEKDKMDARGKVYVI